MSMSDIIEGFGALFTIVFVAAGVIVLLGLLAWLFQWGWNYAMINALTIAKPIDYWTAVVLVFVMGGSSTAWMWKK